MESYPENTPDGNWSEGRGAMTRLDWWLAVLLVVGALTGHALFPRYEFMAADLGESNAAIVAAAGGILTVRVDRWAGDVDLGLVCCL